MAVKCVQYCAPQKLTCADDAGATVLLCLQDEFLVSPVECPEGNEYPFTFVEATLKYACIQDSVCGPVWTYTFEYDTDVLSDLVSKLASSDIVGITCKNCFHLWAEELIGLEPYIEDGIFVSNHGCEYPIAGAGGDITVEDTNSVDLTLASDVISADVKISATAENAISIETDGLYAQTGAWWPGVTLFGDGDDGDLTVLNGEDEEIPERARNMFYENLTVDDGGTLHPYGLFWPEGADTPSVKYYKGLYILFVSGTLTLNGTISANGGDGTAGVGAIVPGVSQGGAGFTQTLPYKSPGGGAAGGGPGGRGQRTGAGAANKAWNGLPTGEGAGSTATGLFTGGFGGAGGDGGSNGAVAGAPGGDPAEPIPDIDNTNVVTFTTNNSFADFARIPFLHLFNRLTSTAVTPADLPGYCGGTGGGGGGGGTRTGTALGGCGGSGGGGGASIFIFARNIVIGVNGRIESIGGNGGAGANATPGGGGDSAGGGGGGGAGGGGTVYLAFNSLVNNGTIDVSGGAAGGTGGAPVGSGVAGEDGLPGADGHVYLMHVPDGVLNYV